MKHKNIIKIIKSITGFLVVFLFVFILTVVNAFSSTNFMLSDYIYKDYETPNPNIKIIAIDDKTLEELGNVSTWSRRYYADIINYLCDSEASKPAVIGIDVIFEGAKDAYGDEALVSALEHASNVVSVSQLIYSERAFYDNNNRKYYAVSGIIKPYERLERVLDTGFSNVSLDSDNKLRRISANVLYDGVAYNSFSECIYNKYCEKQGIPVNKIKHDNYGRSIIRYVGKPGDYDVFSFIDVLNGNVDPELFEDSIILIGAYAPAMMDSYSVPAGGSKEMYGVEIHANVIQNYMENRFSTNANPVIIGIVTGLIAGLIHIFFRKKNMIANAIVLITATCVFFITCRLISQSGIYITLLYFPLVLVIDYIICTISGYLVERYKKLQIVNAFKKYMSPDVVEEIATNGEDILSLRGVKKDIAVLFVDIRGFTSLSEVLDPIQVVDILDRYLELVTECVFKNHGTLDKYIGDAVMAVFNSPFDLDDYCLLACRTALDIVECGKVLEEEMLNKYGKTVGFGIGVNCGEAVVGNVGCQARMDFTAIGDTVNTAARLEANAPKGMIYISENMYNRMSNQLKDKLKANAVGEIHLKGKKEALKTYELISIDGKDK